jgi:proteasome lid subunit RPN8/RPN11
METMRAHVESCAPLEACGLLAGKDGLVSRVILITNKAQSPFKYMMDPVEQLRAFDQIEAESLDLLAIFHSHPAGPDTASPTDIAEAAYPVVQIIWSRLDGTWKARGFRIENRQLLNVNLEITDGE